MPTITAGLNPPATPVSVSPHAAIVRAAHVAGSLERVTLPIVPRGIRDQSGLEACVSCALAAAMEAKNAGWPLLSPMYHYRAARVDRRGGDAAGRLTMAEGLTTLEGSGVSTQRLHKASFDEAGLALVPSLAARADAAARRLRRQGLFSAWESIGSASRVVSIRHHLKRGRPVLLGLLLPNSYPAAFLASGHQWDNPSVPLSSDGHCVLTVGYDDVKLALRIQDSRGDYRGFDQGCWWMGYAVADSPAIVSAVSLL
jgi:hypothetical protein